MKIGSGWEGGRIRQDLGLGREGKACHPQGRVAMAEIQQLEQPICAANVQKTE